MATSLSASNWRARLEARLTREWQLASPWQLLLRPPSWLFALLVALRKRLFQAGAYQTSRIDVPVIIIGNITVGGSGKTPLVIALVEMLRARGYRPGVVSRGYGANATEGVSQRAMDDGGAQWVEPGLPEAATRFGDEPVLLARRLQCPVFIGRNRVAAAQAMRRRFPDVDVVIADDGLQHYALARDIEIAVLDGKYGVGNGAMLPAGPLREPLSRLASVDAIAVYRAGDGLSQSTASLSADIAIEGAATPMISTPIFAAHLDAECFVNLRSGERTGVAEFSRVMAGKSIHALAGIARPQRFFAQLQQLGLSVTAHPLADHHRFSEADFVWPGSDNAQLILMTEKDAVKCWSIADARCWYLRVDTVLPLEFYELVLQRLHELKRL